jgi:hypothetical protein
MPAARIPYAFARIHGVLALAEEDGAVVVLTRPDATVDGIAELKRVLQRPLTLRSVDAERFAMELARAYNAPSAGIAQVSDDLSREIDLTRLMQDLRPRGSARQRGPGAGDPDDQRAVAAGAARTRLRSPLRAL